jgi:hypothetical protein
MTRGAKNILEGYMRNTLTENLLGSALTKVLWLVGVSTHFTGA